MWYIVQTKTGDESELKLLIENLGNVEFADKCFVPLYEEVHRSGGECRIFFRRFFPGYIFVDTDRPEELFRVLRSIPEFTRLLGMRETDGSVTFIPVSEEDKAFLSSLMVDGCVHVSYIRMSGNGRIEKIAGPLAGYRNHIVKLDIPHRRAIVETEMFGRKRRIRFGLWMDADPKLPWITGLLSDEPNGECEKALDEGSSIDIGIYVGDHIVDESGIYGDQIFTVTAVDPKRRTVRAQLQLLNTIAGIELPADSVSVVK